MQEWTRFLKYVGIGLLTTLATLFLWNLLIIISSSTGIDYKIRFSVAQYLASVLLIYPSFWLNRKITFKDKNDRHGGLRTSTVKAFVVYTISPLTGSLVTFILQSILPDIFNPNWFAFGLKIGILSLQLIGVGVGVVINYFGQKLWIYK